MVGRLHRFHLFLIKSLSIVPKGFHNIKRNIKWNNTRSLKFSHIILTGGKWNERVRTRQEEVSGFDIGYVIGAPILSRVESHCDILSR